MIPDGVLTRVSQARTNHVPRTISPVNVPILPDGRISSGVSVITTAVVNDATSVAALSVKRTWRFVVLAVGFTISGMMVPDGDLSMRLSSLAAGWAILMTSDVLSARR